VCGIVTFPVEGLVDLPRGVWHGRAVQGHRPSRSHESASHFGGTLGTLRPAEMGLGRGHLPHYNELMSLRRSVRICLLAVGVWLALAPAVATMPAMAVMSQMTDHTGDNCCDACPDTDMNRATCALMCLGAAYFSLAPEQLNLMVALKDGSWPGSVPFLSGRSARPDPAPPKPFFS
jgi:hypothetical protein